jgi:hypothetical protein
MALEEPVHDPDHEPPEGETLPCGRSLMAVWESADERGVAADPHLAACPHCSAAIAELRALREVVARGRAGRKAADDPGRAADGMTDAVTDGMAERVMDIVRREPRPGRTLPLGGPAEDAWIVEAAAAKTFRAAVEALAGVRAGSCRIAPLDRAEGGSPPRGPVRVRLEVVAEMTWTVPWLADAVRDRVADAARETLGLDVRVVDVVVVDLVDGRIR